MSIFDLKKKDDALKDFASQSLVPQSRIAYEHSGIFNRVRSFFNPQREKSNTILSITPSDEHRFYCKEALQPEDVMLCEYPAILNTKNFYTIKNAKKKKSTKHAYKETPFRGMNINFINVSVSPSHETKAIIEECIHAGSTQLSNKQPIQTLPQLCQYYLLTEEEIKTLCYIVYDCSYIQQTDCFKGSSSMSIARYLCKERRHILRFSITEYASLMQHITITHPSLSFAEILIWINALSRIAQLVSSLTPIEDNISLLTALIWIPRKVLISLSQGRTIDKSLLNLIRNDKTISLAMLQAYIIIVAVARIITQQTNPDTIDNAIAILLTIDHSEYLDSSSPVIALTRSFKDIQNRFLFLLQSNKELFTHCFTITQEKHESDHIFIILQEVNAILYTLLRMEQLYQRNLTHDEAIAIINRLSQSTVDIIRFYGINPKEVFTEDGGFYFSLLQLLAYMQYNRNNQVLPQSAVIMKFIPLHLYQNAEKPYKELQQECNAIITQCPHIIDIHEFDLENIFLEKLLLLPVDTQRDINFFKDIERIVIALQKIRSIQTRKSSNLLETLSILCRLPDTTLHYISRFPELFFSRFLDNFPADLFDSIYTALYENYTKHSFHYKILISCLSPLSIVDDNDQDPTQKLEDYVAKASQIIENMASTLTCREDYTDTILFEVITTLMPLYYKYPFQEEAPLHLVRHVNLVLEVITHGSQLPLQELCHKPKNILRKYRKELQEKKKESL